MKEEWAKSLEDDEAGWLARGLNGAHNSSTSGCFEIYGFDILVDNDLKPWLLEVNICPSLSSGSPLDKRIKTKLVADTLTLVGLQVPPSVWKRSPGSVKRPSSDVVGMACDDGNASMNAPPSPEDVAKRSAMLSACKNPLEAIALFDEFAWELVIEAHDQDMRCGGLERIFPTARSSAYLPFLPEESYANLVLRKWYEADGGTLFSSEASSRTLPPWVPRQVIFEHT